MVYLYWCSCRDSSSTQDMSVPISLLFLISSLLHFSSSTVYIVTPDDHHHPNSTCHHCYNLQYYLLNAAKYFTSNTKLLFLPGLHHLSINLVIHNVYNISLIGSTADDKAPVSVIQYSSALDGIALSNSTMITIENFLIKMCKDMYYWTALEVLNCYHVQLNNMIIDMKIKVHNMMGDSILSDIISGNSFDITYDDNISLKLYDINHTLTIYSYAMSKQSLGGIMIKITQLLYGVSIIISDSVFSLLDNQLTMLIKSGYTTYENIIIFEKVHFSNNHYLSCLLYIHFDIQKVSYSKTAIKRDKVIFYDCLFTDSTNIHQIIYCNWIHEAVSIVQSVIITNCLVENITNCSNILRFTSDFVIRNRSMILIDNTNFTSNTHNNKHSTMVSSDSPLVLSGPCVIIHDNTFEYLFANDNHIVIHQDTYIEFSENKATYMIQNNGLGLLQNVIINITRNTILYLFVAYNIKNKHIHNPIPSCFFQFIAYQKSNITSSIIVESNNLFISIFRNNAGNINCRMLQDTPFYKHNPLQVYQQFMYLKTDVGLIPIPFDTGMMCYCLEEMQKCDINQLGPIFPGQTLTIKLCINHRVELSIKTIMLSVAMYYVVGPHCKVPVPNYNRITRNCTKLRYTVLANNDKQCELLLVAEKYRYYTAIFYIKLLKCPTGFSFKVNAEKCVCDPEMQSSLLTIRECNIDDQTILRHGNSWMTGVTYNNSHTYHISPRCPFDYCLPQSSYLNFSTPNSQCQFHRSGLLCGQCQQNLSAILGSSNCKLCSNISLLIIIPVTVAGVFLVLVLFCINLTVTDGTVNAFIMYANIISINDHVFFTNNKHVFTPVYTFISLANLDLGIQTCFYNGMDDYAKMWLQLAFPVYLMLIAALLIATSRYSITVQRVTARRALPILATLFLLTYTKILRTVSSVLFSYSTITHLPSNDKTLVWSVDANVPLFGIKFTLLFIVCLILFFVLIPFNIILLFTRTLSRFQFINRFKPLLDAYQGPYKQRFYYWTGLQLLIRALFYGISTLDTSVNLAVSTIALSVIIGLHGVASPLKSKFKNYQELLYIINLQILYILTSQYQGTTIVNVMVTLAAIQFIFIIVYHIITYSYNGVIKIKISYFTNMVTVWIGKLNKPSNVDLHDRLHNIEIPEVTYNYREFREPLVGLHN